jgi:hypothetical protein
LRVLLDECVPRRLRRELSGLDVSHVTSEGWAGRRNGVLLRLMRAEGFATLVTVDRNLAFQQDIPGSGVAVVILRARSNRLPDLLPLVPALREALAQAQPGHVAEVGV